MHLGEQFKSGDIYSSERKIQLTLHPNSSSDTESIYTQNSYFIISDFIWFCFQFHDGFYSPIKRYSSYFIHKEYLHTITEHSPLFVWFQSLFE